MRTGIDIFEYCQSLHAEQLNKLAISITYKHCIRSHYCATRDKENS